MNGVALELCTMQAKKTNYPIQRLGILTIEEAS
jgi:hypothetical protein